MILIFIRQKKSRKKLLGIIKLMYGNYFDKFINKYINFIYIENNYKIISQNHIIRVKEVSHFGIKTYGFIVDSKLGITGDSSLCNNIKFISNNCKILICDCSKEIGDIYHMGIDNIKQLILQNKQLKIIPTHFRDNTKKILKELDLKNVLIIDDGYEFIIDN